MAEEMQDLSIGDMEAVAGGKVRITTPTHTDRMDTKKLYTLTWHAMNNFKSIDSVLEQCKTEQERKFVYKTWDQLTGAGRCTEDKTANTCHALTYSWRRVASTLARRPGRAKAWWLAWLRR
jgi:hypothetical protein